MDLEIIVVNKVVKKAVWLKKVIENLSERGSNPYIPTLYYNNLRGINLIKNTKFYNKAKHIKIYYFFI
jgi:hypothetical protein